MPDRLEDFEGFYGLEEIDDVEVVRDSTTGQISFETTKSEAEVAREKEEAKGAEAEALRELEEELREDQDATDGEESWEGFSDEEEALDGKTQGKEAQRRPDGRRYHLSRVSRGSCENDGPENRSTR